MDNKNANAERRKSGRELLGVSLMPWFNLCFWAIASLTVRLCVKRFPDCTWEDVPWIPFLIGCPLLLVTAISLFGSIPIFYLLFFQRAKRWNDGTAWRADVVYGLGWATNFFLAWADPGHYFQCFMTQTW